MSRSYLLYISFNIDIIKEYIQQVRNSICPIIIYNDVSYKMLPEYI